MLCKYLLCIKKRYMEKLKKIKAKIELKKKLVKVGRAFTRPWKEPGKVFRGILNLIHCYTDAAVVTQFLTLKVVQEHLNERFLLPPWNISN